MGRPIKYKTEEERRQAILEYKRKYNKAHREEKAAYMRKWRKENAEHVNEYNREYARNYYRLNKHKHNHKLYRSYRGLSSLSSYLKLQI